MSSDRKWVLLLLLLLLLLIYDVLELAGHYSMYVT